MESCGAMVQGFGLSSPRLSVTGNITHNTVRNSRNLEIPGIWEAGGVIALSSQRIQLILAHFSTSLAPIWVLDRLIRRMVHGEPVSRGKHFLMTYNPVPWDGLSDTRYGQQALIKTSRTHPKSTPSAENRVLGVDGKICKQLIFNPYAEGEQYVDGRTTYLEVSCFIVGPEGTSAN
ncbi:hypothetical protein C8R44DRAFT_726229 [Mycena epipterygia]|nr:hypothetical protein C8R44DRAFT_726229 [Mycena epipterygia]